jgi:hypothetical protein
MEYVVGAILTLIIVATANKLIAKQLSKKRMPTIRYSQSHIYSVVAPMMFGLDARVPYRSTQSTNYQEESYTKVVISENKAYWIKENTFYMADVVNGMVDKETTQQVDTMSMSDVELKKMLVIVETLRESDNNDSGGTGKS